MAAFAWIPIWITILHVQSTLAEPDYKLLLSNMDDYNTYCVHYHACSYSAPVPSSGTESVGALRLDCYKNCMSKLTEIVNFCNKNQNTKRNEENCRDTRIKYYLVEREKETEQSELGIAYVMKKLVLDLYDELKGIITSLCDGCETVACSPLAPYNCETLRHNCLTACKQCAHDLVGKKVISCGQYGNNFQNCLKLLKSSDELKSCQEKAAAIKPSCELTKEKTTCCSSLANSYYEQKCNHQSHGTTLNNALNLLSEIASALTSKPGKTC